jgi:hypothetical protein
VVTCFAHDSCAMGSGGAYLEARSSADGVDMGSQIYVGTGISVSPDNLMMWDVVPYSEQMVYRPATIRRKYSWQPANNTTSLQVIVKYADGAPVAFADITVGSAHGQADANGAFVFTGLPLGGTVAVASKMVDNRWLRVEASTVLADSNAPLVLTLKDDQLMASMRYRTVVVSVNALIHEDESPMCWGCEEDEARINGVRTVHLNPAHPTETLPFAACAGDEAQGEIEVMLALNPNNTVTVNANFRLYESTSCGANLRTQKKMPELIAPVGGSISYADLLRYGPENNWDFMSVERILVENNSETFATSGP